MDKKEENEVKVPFLNPFAYRTKTIFKGENGNTTTIIDYTIKNEAMRQKLKWLANGYSERLHRITELLQIPGNLEIDHQEADEILCEQLIDIGMHELVNKYRKIKKYYA